MSVFWQELRFHRTSFIVWGAVLFFITLLFFGAFEVIDIGESYLEMVESIPEPIKSAFLVESLSIGEVHGYFASQVYLYLVLLVGIYTAILCGTMFAKEEDQRTAEFLYTKPISRESIFFQKFGSGFVHVLGIHLVIALGVCSTLLFIITAEVKPIVFLYLLVMLLISSLSVAGVSFLLSTFLSSEKAALTFGIAFVLLSYVLSIVSDMIEPLKWLGYLTYFSYLSEAQIVLNSELPFDKVIILLLVFILTSVLALWRMKKKDISA